MVPAEKTLLNPFVPPSAHTSLPALLLRRAALHPHRTAVVHGGARMTYRKLVRDSSELAGRLNGLGVAEDDCVGLFVEPSLELMTGAWGILFSGAAYLPLSPDYPEDRVRYMIEDSRTDVIVAQEHLAERLASLAPPGTRIVTPADARGAGRVLPSPRPDALAYVIYTSGSTGRPKGVLIEHRSVASQLRWLHTCGYLGEDVTVLQKTPMSFDAAQWEILAPATGARVVMGTPGIHRDVQGIVAAVTEHRVSTLQCVPTLLQALLDTDDFLRCTTLTRVFCGGEALSRQLARTFYERLPWARLVNLYGPTEATINTTACPVDPDTLGEGPGTIPIGVPVDNTQCFILDENLAPVDIEEPGELYVGGVQLARSYLRRPEETRQRFIPSPFVPTQRLYRTGDLAYWNKNGTIQFTGRADNQVKLRGHRVELDEVAVAVEEHTWVRRAAAIVTDDARTGSANLVACVELNPKEAALMDQGNHGGHHQSKASKLQVKAQLSDPGIRDPRELDGRPVLPLPGRQETGRQRREVFARKTYRFFEGGKVSRADLEKLLALRPAGGSGRGLGEVTSGELGEILRWFGQYHSDQRLLPKYAYASPGALYATQMYLETDGVGGQGPGVYYYHPADHSLVRVGDALTRPGPYLLVHFVGKRRAIEPVYRNNIQEVLEFEAGHMVGVFEDVLPGHGLGIRPLAHEPSAKDRLDVADEDFYLGTFEIRGGDGAPPEDPTEIYVQAHPGRVDDLPAGQYRWTGGRLEHVSDQLVLPRHVIAINQQVHERACFGITAVSRADRPWLEYIALGTKLHHLQRNGLGLGLMSSGYSSKSGNPLPAARRVDDILTSCGFSPGASYFFLGGRVSTRQISSEGMHEDAVHMKGPAEMIKDELARVLPDYMIPNRVLILDELPLTANGKVDTKALAASDAVVAAGTATPYVAPATPSEIRLARLWGDALKYEDVSAEDDFFASGGNSLTAVSLVGRINREFGVRLPLQVVFESPRLADLARRVDGDTGEPAPRLIRLHGEGTAAPVFCWPGLGGYPMNLRGLARRAFPTGRPFYGIQAQGINAGEAPHPTVREMAAADVAEIRRLRPQGPYTLWGYSFGARVAFEAAWQLEQAGERVDHVFLICPGNPKVRRAGAARRGRAASLADPAYAAILFSVFTGTVSGPDLDRCLARAHDEEGFAAFVHGLLPELDEALIRRIMRVVALTFEFDYTFRELADRRLNAPVTLFRAAEDDYSFIEGRSGYSAAPPTVIDLAGDHYGVLKEEGVAELVSAIHARLGL